MSGKYTERQKYVLERIAGGARIVAYIPWNGRLCFKSNNSGLKSVLNLTSTMRSLRNKGAVLCPKDGTCVITESGLRAIEVNNEQNNHK